MTVINFDLAQPEGTSLPTGMTLVQGSFAFDGVGLRSTGSGDNIISHSGVSQGEHTYNIESISSTSAYLYLEFRRKDATGLFYIRWISGSNTVDLEKRDSEIQKYTLGSLVGPEYGGGNQQLEIKLNLIDDAIFVFINGEILYDQADDKWIEFEDMRIVARGNQYRFTSIDIAENAVPINDTPYLELDLAQAEGTQLPTGLKIVQGSFAFDGVGLRSTGSGDNIIEHTGDSQGRYVYNIQALNTTSSYVYLEFRRKDETGLFYVRWISGSNQVNLEKRDSATQKFTEAQLTGSQYGGNNRELEIIFELIGDNILITVNGDTLYDQIELTYNEYENMRIVSRNNQYRFTALKLTNNDVDSEFEIPPLTELSSVLGFKREVINRKRMFDRPATFPQSELEEFWPWTMKTQGIPDWPSEQYPLIMYTSTDHADGEGGVWVRVYEKLSGSINNPDAWHEWDDISNRSEFSHITKKTTPIYQGGQNQCETPSSILLNGVVYLYTHENGGSGLPSQGTRYATSNNGIDFSSATNSTFVYDPDDRQGDGHTGYFEFGINPIQELLNPATGNVFGFIGAALHGGSSGVLDGPNDASQMLGSDDGVNWKRINYFRRADPEIMKYNQPGDDGFVYGRGPVHRAIKEGAYYRIPTRYRPRSGAGNEVSAGYAELLYNSNFQIVSKPSFYFTPAVGQFDEYEAISANEFEYEGKVYQFYKTVEIDPSGPNYSAIGFAEVVSVPYSWEIITPYSNEVVIANHVSDGSSPVSGFTYSQTALGSQSDDRNFTKLVLPQNQSVSSAIAVQGFNLLDNDMTLVRFDNIGKDSIEPIELEFGLVDDLANPTKKISVKWSGRSASNATALSEEMMINSIGSLVDFDNVGAGERYGQSDNWRNLEGGESVFAKHNIGFKFIPAEKRVLITSGSSNTRIKTIKGFYSNVALKPFIIAKFTTSEQSSTGNVSVSDISVKGYSSDPIGVPESPNVTVTKNENSITLSTVTTNNLTGFRYFLNSVEQPNNVFNNLITSTEYEVYARSYNANGDSPPSTVRKVTTTLVRGIVDISNFPWAECSITENRSQFVIDTLALRRKKRSKGHHRYELELATIDMPMDQGRDIKAKLSSGHDAKFTFIHPRLGFTRGTEPEQGIKSNNDYVAGLREIALKSDGEWQLLSGDLITFSNHTKVYEVVGSTAKRSGVSTIALTSPLQKPVSVNEVVNVNNVAWTLISDSVIEVSMEASENQDMMVVLNAVEDLQ